MGRVKEKWKSSQKKGNCKEMERVVKRSVVKKRKGKDMKGKMSNNLGISLKAQVLI